MHLDEHHRFTLTVPEPFHFQRTVAKPAGWHWSTPEEIFRDGVLWTGIYVRDRPVGLKMYVSEKEVHIMVHSRRPLSLEDVSTLKSLVWYGLGGDEDLAGFYQFAGNDPVLSAAVEDLYGMRLGSLDDVFGRTILAILLQMAPMTRSDQMMTALLKYYGNRIMFDGEEVILWPRPTDLANADPDDLKRKANLGYRAGRLVQAAQFLAKNPMSIRALSNLPEKEAIGHLLEIPGVGEYSAGIILGQTSLPLDVWSVVIMSELMLGRPPENPRAEINSVSSMLTERWGRWRWFAFVYIVNDLENLAKRFHLSRIR